MHIPLPCVEISGVGDLALPLTEMRSLAVHPSMATTHAHVAYKEPNITAFRSIHVSVSFHFDSAVQLVAQNHCLHLGMRSIDQDSLSTPLKPPSQPVVVATLRSLVLVWSSDYSCVIPDLQTTCTQAGGTNNNIGCLFLQLPAAYGGGQLSFRSTGPYGKVESHDMSAQSRHLFQATSFYTDAVSHSISSVTNGNMVFLLYDLHLTAACGHVPSPKIYPRLKEKMTQLVSQWAHDANMSEMYAFSLHCESESISDLLKDMQQHENSRLNLLKDCGNVCVFVVMMSKDIRGWPENHYNHHEHDDEEIGWGSDIDEVYTIYIGSDWFTLEENLVTLEYAQPKPVKNRHMMG